MATRTGNGKATGTARADAAKASGAKAKGPAKAKGTAKKTAKPKAKTAKNKAAKGKAKTAGFPASPRPAGPVAPGGGRSARPSTNANGVHQTAALTPGTEPDDVLAGLVK